MSVLGQNKTMDVQVGKTASGQTSGQSAGQWGAPNSAGVSIASSISFQNVCYAYHETLVLSGVTLEAAPGEILCLLGPSGSGKTTLLRIAAGLEVPDTGTVKIDNLLVDGDGVHVETEQRGIGLVFQDFALFPHLTILDNVKFGLAQLNRKDATTQANRMLERVGMLQYAGVYPDQISGGEQQRVALARALAPRPQIVLMDEPFSGLDARLRDTIRADTVELLRDTRSTAIIVTHDPEEALRVADRIALMKDGNLVQFGRCEELYHRPNSLFSAQFFSEVNIFKHTVKTGMVDTPLGKFKAKGFSDGDLVNICVRLSDLDLKAATVEGEGVAQIRSRRFMGVVELIELGIDGRLEPVRVRIRAGSLDKDVRYVRLSSDMQKIMIFSA
ncbi:MAG: ABC transporter ATP-binding protein [Rhizobiaceae bacterium]